MTTWQWRVIIALARLYMHDKGFNIMNEDRQVFYTNRLREAIERDFDDQVSK